LDSRIGKYSKDFSNLPERYLIRKTRKLYYKSEDHPGLTSLIFKILEAKI
jgi:hypothetical protein